MVYTLHWMWNFNEMWNVNWTVWPFDLSYRMTHSARLYTCTIASCWVPRRRKTFVAIANNGVTLPHLNCNQQTCIFLESATLLYPIQILFLMWCSLPRLLQYFVIHRLSNAPNQTAVSKQRLFQSIDVDKIYIPNQYQYLRTSNLGPWNQFSMVVKLTTEIFLFCLLQFIELFICPGNFDIVQWLGDHSNLESDFWNWRPLWSDVKTKRQRI